MAYCQSQLYVNYIKDKYGAAAIGDMLMAYRDSLSTAEVIQRVCKVDKETFEKGYRASLDETIKPLQRGKPAAKQRTMAELKKAYEKDNDVDAGAELALVAAPRSRSGSEVRRGSAGPQRKSSQGHYVLARLEEWPQCQARAYLAGAGAEHVAVRLFCWRWKNTTMPASTISGADVRVRRARSSRSNRRG